MINYEKSSDQATRFPDIDAFRRSFDGAEVCGWRACISRAKQSRGLSADNMETYPIAMENDHL